MQIIGNFYKLTSIDDNSPFWDLELLKQIKSKTNPRQEYVNAGYGMTLESAINRIIQYAITSKYNTISLGEYLKEYKSIKDEITKEVNGVN